jgi:hypothetical protein
VDKPAHDDHPGDVERRRTRSRHSAAILLMVSVVLLGTGTHARAELLAPPTVPDRDEPLGPTTVTDRNDVRKRLDIRSVTVVTVSAARTRVELVFWNPVPPSFLRDRAARVEVHDHYFVRFWPGRRHLRVTWGDAASACCLVHRASHPDPYTYVTVIFLDGVEPPPTEVRGFTTGMLDCTHGLSCGSGGGEMVDRTQWKDL